jgi:hypothetical protein
MTHDPDDVADAVIVAARLAVASDDRLEELVRIGRPANVLLPGQTEFEVITGHHSSVPVSAA